MNSKGIPRKRRPVTNADRIRKMTDEELMLFIEAVRCCALFGRDCGVFVCQSMDGDLCAGQANKKKSDYQNTIDQTILDWLKKEV